MERVKGIEPSPRVEKLRLDLDVFPLLPGGVEITHVDERDEEEVDGKSLVALDECLPRTTSSMWRRASVNISLARESTLL
jgi:hypothetical protein